MTGVHRKVDWSKRMKLDVFVNPFLCYDVPRDKERGHENGTEKRTGV